MSRNLRIALAQVDTLVGDIEGNARLVAESAHRARDELQARAVLFPELTLTGYPPEDLLLRPDLHIRVLRAIEEIKRDVEGITMVVGHPQQAPGGLFNAASVLRDGHTLAVYHKQHLPNYGVFDEKRYFASGGVPCVVDVDGVPVGVTICEDVWVPGPLEQAAVAGARIILNINASPFHVDKGREREAVVQRRVEAARVPVVYLNSVGGQDELVFDGGSFVMGEEGTVTHRFPAFEPGLFPVDFLIGEEGARPEPATIVPVGDEVETVYRALVLGIRDYVRKNGFNGVVIGLSGGIDSALTLALAVDALGADSVEAVMMPSRYTSDMSLEDAAEQARSLGVHYHVVPIEPMFRAFLDGLSEILGAAGPDTTEENIQARCRGVILMAVSNKRGRMVLTTGNKSEMAVGYATLYGDMVGGYGALKDVPKTLVYRLADYRNRISPAIPQRVIQRPPSAELAPDQKDTDSLPPYDTLDPILEMYVERDMDAESIAAQGYELATVERVIRMVDRNEYKRRQAPPGVRVTRRAFGRDRRYPITSGFGRRR